MKLDFILTVLNVLMFCLVANQYDVSFGTGFVLLLNAFSAGFCFERLMR